MSESASLTVAVVEDDARVRRSLVEIVQQSAGCQCMGDYGSGEEAVKGLSKLPARVVLMDINLPGISGVECVRQLAGILLETQFVMLTTYKDSDNIFDALAAGASGYLIKPVRARELLAAIKDVDRGGAPMTSSIARQVVAFFQRKPAPSPKMSAKMSDAELSEREHAVLKLLSEGCLYKQVAAELGVSINTIYEHIRRIYRKLKVHSRQEAVECYRARR